MIISKQLQGNQYAPTLKLEITPKPYDVETNTTPVEYTYTIERPLNVSSSGNKPYSIKIGDKVINGNTTIGGVGTKQIRTGTVDVKHNPDGSKTVNCSFSMEVDISWNGTPNGTVSNNANVKLPDIPQATQPTIDGEVFELGDTITVKMIRASTIFTHTLKLMWNGHKEVIGQDLGISKTWTIPLSLANYLTTGTKLEGKVVCDTYNNGRLIGSKSVDITLKIPVSVMPTIQEINVTETNPGVSEDVFVQNHSKLNVQIIGKGIYNSRITYVSSELDGVTYSGSQFKTDTLNFNGTKQLVTKLKDSRGRMVTKTTDITVMPYYVPRIYVFEADRCNADGTLDPTGENIKVEYYFDIAPIGNRNTRKVVFEYAEIESENFTKFYEITTDYSKDSNFVSEAIFDIDKTYMIRIVVSDTYTPEGIQSYFMLESEDVTFDVHFTGQGMAFGKVAEEPDLFDVDWKAKFRKDVSFYQDIEWTSLPLDAKFKAYNDVTANTPKYRIRGKTVEIRGVVSPKEAFSSTFAKVPFATLPSTIIPSDDLPQLCAGSNKETWTLTVGTDGNLSVSQYGLTSYGTVGANSRLAFQMTYTLD